MRTLLLFLIAFCSFVSAIVAKSPIPVFHPLSGGITDACSETIGDMTYGRNTFVLLRTEQAAVICIGYNVREVIDLPDADANHIAYGNGRFVVSGNRGNLYCSSDLHEWQRFQFDGTAIHPWEHDLPNQALPYSTQLSLSYHPEHRHFFLETDTGDVFVSRDGSVWGKWTDGTSAPAMPYPQITDTRTVFEHNGNFLMFQRANNLNSVWDAFRSKDGKTWNPSGRLTSNSVPQKAFFRSGTWLVHVGTTISTGIDSTWNTGVDDAYNISGFPVAFSAGRYHHNRILGLKDGSLSEFADGRWNTLGQSSASDLRFLPGLDRFILLHDMQGRVEATYDGSDFATLCQFDDFQPNGIAENRRRLVITGTDSGFRPVVWSSIEPLPSETGLSGTGPVAFVDGGNGIDWTSYPDPEYPGAPKITSFADAFYLATGYHLYRSTDGLYWEKVFEPDPASWISALYTYRDRLWVGTTNYYMVPRIYVPPPEGIDPKNALYSISEASSEWKETVIEDQVYLSRPSLDGPHLLDFAFGVPFSTAIHAQSGSDLSKTFTPWPAFEGSIIWAYGRYYLFTGDMVLKTHFMGFEDADYHAQKETAGTEFEPWIDTGYFGHLKPGADPLIHSTLGEIRVVEKPGFDGVVYILSQRWGALEMKLDDSPYAYSPFDDTIYYINFHAPSDVNFESDAIMDTPFYNHRTQQWTRRLSCEFWEFDQWFPFIQRRVEALKTELSSLMQLIQDGSIADASRSLETIEVEWMILETLKWPASHENHPVDPGVREFRYAQIEAAMEAAKETAAAARQAFRNSYAYEP